MADFVKTTYICGGMGMGKDTFVKDLQESNITLTMQQTIFTKWEVYIAAEEKKYDDLYNLFWLGNASKITRVALADPLKKETHEYLFKKNNIPADAFEHCKNTLLVPNPKNPSEYKTIREWYIWFGAEGRKTDLDIWCKKATNEIEKVLQARNIPIVTDWRFRNEIMPKSIINELNNKKILLDPEQDISIRLFRSGVKIAAPEVDSEHDLDQIKTKYLFVGPGDFKNSLKLYPQYQDYKKFLNIAAV
jgi:hypothetical protein